MRRLPATARSAAAVRFSGAAGSHGRAIAHGDRSKSRLQLQPRFWPRRVRRKMPTVVGLIARAAEWQPVLPVLVLAALLTALAYYQAVIVAWAQRAVADRLSGAGWTNLGSADGTKCYAARARRSEIDATSYGGRESPPPGDGRPAQVVRGAGSARLRVVEVRRQRRRPARGITDAATSERDGAGGASPAGRREWGVATRPVRVDGGRAPSAEFWQKEPRTLERRARIRAGAERRVRPGGGTQVARADVRRAPRHGRRRGGGSRRRGPRERRPPNSITKRRRGGRVRTGGRGPRRRRGRRLRVPLFGLWRLFARRVPRARARRRPPRLARLLDGAAIGGDVPFDEGAGRRAGVVGRRAPRRAPKGGLRRRRRRASGGHPRTVGLGVGRPRRVPEAGAEIGTSPPDSPASPAAPPPPPPRPSSRRGRRLQNTRYVVASARRPAGAPRPNVAVVGAGLGGLAAARALRRGGADVRVFERATRLGLASRSVAVGAATVDVPLRAIPGGANQTSRRLRGLLGAIWSATPTRRVGPAQA